MKTYYVYRHPTLEYLDIVKIGFSWPAMLFTLPWMLVKRLWLHAVVYVLASAVVTQVSDVAEKSESGALEWVAIVGILALLFLPGFMGNKWREGKLRRVGFQFLGALQAPTHGAAVAQAREAFGSTLTEIFSSTDRAEVMVVKSLLAAEKIPFQTRGESTGLANIPVTILVPLQEKEKCLRLLDSRNSSLNAPRP